MRLSDLREGSRVSSRVLHSPFRSRPLFAAVSASPLQERGHLSSHASENDAATVVAEQARLMSELFGAGVGGRGSSFHRRRR